MGGDQLPELPKQAPRSLGSVNQAVGAYRGVKRTTARPTDGIDAKIAGRHLVQQPVEHAPAKRGVSTAALQAEPYTLDFDALFHGGRSFFNSGDSPPRWHFKAARFLQMSLGSQIAAETERRN